MARTYNITDGAARTVNLISITGIIPPRGGFGSVKLAPHAYDAGAAAERIVVERWRLNLIATSHDNAATQLAALLDLLRDAWRYHKDPLFNDPIYITQQTTGETGTRYALVHQAPEISNPDFFNHPFEADNLIEDIGIAIARGPWRSAAPGVKGSALTLTPSDGPASPEIVHIANHRDNHPITQILRYERGRVWAADFELADPDRMWIADNASLSMGDIDMFMAGSFTPESLAANMDMVGKWDGVAANSEYVLYYDNAASRFVFGISDGAAIDTVVANNFGAPAIDTEYFICVWHTTATSEIGISINNGTPDTGVSARFPQDGNRDFTIGDGHGGGILPYDGLAKSIGVWKAECTAALRTSLYNSGFPKFYAELTAAELVGLEAWWEFGSAGLAFPNDSHGANNLANVGAVQVAGRTEAWAADFEAGDPDRMWIADNAALSTGNIDFYMAGWFTVESNVADSILIGKWGGGAVTSEYCLYLLNAAGANRFRFYISDGVANDSVTANSLGAPALGVEYFIICWHIAATSEIGIQINALAPDTVISARNPQDGNRDFTIGAQSGGAGPYDGLAKACGMWKAECTAALRTSLYNEGLPKLYSELTAAELVGLQAFWEFGSSALAFVNDSHGANNLANVGAVQVPGALGDSTHNLIANAAHEIFATVPAPGDAYYIGSTESFFHTILNLGTAGVYTALALAYEYSDGAAGWPDCVLGDDLTLYPDDEPWNQIGQVAINFAGNEAWALEVVNGGQDYNRHWLRVRIASCTAFNTTPQNATDVVYNQRTPHIEIPATLLKGDVPPYLLMRMRSPAGGDDDPEMSTTSLVLMGAKSRGLSKFVSHLNLGNDGNPAEWTASVADPPCKDASIVADETAPGGDRVDVDFATTASLTTRVRITGTNILEYWRGHYRPFVRAQQIGGVAGDISLRLRVFIDSTDAYSPKYDTTKLGVPMVGVTKGMELVELMPEGVLQLPFAGIEAADEAGLANANLIFDIQAARPSGAATLRIYDLILLPSDEWACGLIDPISDSLTGNSALRGLSLLDLDGGVIANRTVKQLINGGNILMAETWSRGGDRPRLQPLTQTRIYFIFGHYSGAFGTPPYISTLGMHLTYELYAQNCYLFLRGSG